MLRIELSGLSRAELKRLLAAAEARGQTGQAETLRAELAGRAAGGEARPPPPLSFEDDESGPMLAPEEAAPLAFEVSDRRAAAKRQWPVGLAAVAVLAVGGAAVWEVSRAPGWPPAPRAMTVRSAPASAPIAVPTPPPQPPAEPPRSSAEPTIPPPVAPAPVAPAPKAAPEVATAAAPEPAPRRVDPCARPPTPADRLLCNDLALNLLERELRDAYGRALSAGADPTAVRESQAAWRRARDPTSDPRALAGLYDRRIRELKGMTAQAAAAGTAEDAASAPPPPPPPVEERQRN